MTAFSQIGRSIPKLGSEDLVRGSTKFCDDIAMPGMVYGAVLRSPLPHARIKHIRTERAKKLSGVIAVLTGQDSPTVRYGLHVLDETVLALDKVRYVGDEVACVVAADIYTAEEAVKLIEVEYEELPAVFEPAEALREGAPVLHAEIPNNVAYSIDFSYGDFEKAIADSAVVIERTFTTPRQCHMPIETFSCTASWSESTGLQIWSPVQDAHSTRTSLARVFGLPQSKVRVIQPPVGGSYGSKLFHRNTLYVCALLAMQCSSPVRIANTQYEELIAGRPRVPARIKMRIGVNKDGRIVAKEADILADNGAYTSYGAGEFTVMSTRMEALYNIPNVRTSAKLVYTNMVPTAGFRGFGNIVSMFALDSMVDDAAREIGMDPIDFRLKNCVRQGDVTHMNWKIGSCGLPECLEIVRKKTDAWRSEPRQEQANGLSRGVGVACALHVSSNRTRPFDGASALVRLNEDGSVLILSGDGDLGQGLETVFSLIAAETLSVDVDRVQTAPVDTAYSPPGLGIFADRGTTISAKAVQIAAEKLREEILRQAGEMLGAAPADLQLQGGYVVGKGQDQKVSLGDLGRHVYWRRGGHALEALTSYDPDTIVLNPAKGYIGNPSTGYTFSALGVDVEVNEQTGEVKILRAISAHDLGKLINPMLAEGQVRGAFAHGLGFAVNEEFLIEKGRVVNDNMSDYHIPSILDIPRSLETAFVESNETTGPFGAKGLGQNGTLTVAPALANAIREATGRRLTDLPLTSEKVWRGLQEPTRAKKGADKP